MRQQIKILRDLDPDVDDLPLEIVEKIIGQVYFWIDDCVYEDKFYRECVVLKYFRKISKLLTKFNPL